MMEITVISNALGFTVHHSSVQSLRVFESVLDHHEDSRLLRCFCANTNKGTRVLSDITETYPTGMMSNPMVWVDVQQFIQDTVVRVIEIREKLGEDIKLIITSFCTPAFLTKDGRPLKQWGDPQGHTDVRQFVEEFCFDA